MLSALAATTAEPALRATTEVSDLSGAMEESAQQGTTAHQALAHHSLALQAPTIHCQEATTRPHVAAVIQVRTAAPTTSMQPQDFAQVATIVPEETSIRIRSSAQLDRIVLLDLVLLVCVPQEASATRPARARASAAHQGSIASQANPTMALACARRATTAAA